MPEDVVRAIPEAAFTTDAADCVEEWNGLVSKLLGIEPGQALGRPVRELPLGAGKTAWRKDARALAAASGAWRGEIPLVLPDGRRLQVEWSIGRREQGGTLEILRDVTRKRVQLEALRESALYFETMFALPSMGIAMISLDGK